MALEEPLEDDLKFTVDGYDFIIEPSYEVYHKFTVGYSDHFMRRGFIIGAGAGGGSC